METEGKALDEAKVDAAISDLLREEEPEDPEPEGEPAKAQLSFPELPKQAEIDEKAEPKETGLGAAILQKLAELRGAA